MNKLHTRTTRIHLTPDSILHERAFSIEIDDGGAGEFLVIRSAAHQLDIDVEEWPALRDAIDFMIKNVRDEHNTKQHLPATISTGVYKRKHLEI